MSKDKKRLVPVRRFKEFENADAWEQRKLSKLTTEIGTGKSKYKLQDNGRYPILGSTSVIGYDNNFDYTGDFILTARVGANAGNLYRFAGSVKITDNTVFIKSKYNKFLYYYLQKYDLKKLSFGTGQPLVKASELKNLKILKPRLDEEIYRISKLLLSVDNLITLHQRKLDKLKRVKSAYLTEMFPAEGEREPKRRFPGFTGAWEQRKLGEVADVRDGTHDSPRYINEGYPLLTSKNVGNGYINYDDVKYVSENDYVQINKRSKVDINDILMGMIGTIGNLALIREEPDFAIKNVALIKHTSNFDYQFLFQELQTSAISKELLSGMDGGTQKFVSLKKIRNLSVMLPSENEQKQIGAFFKQFDSLIALHQRKLDKLQKLKNAYLNEMFV